MVDLSRSKRSAQVLFDTPSAFHFASKSRSASVNCLYRLILNHLPRLILGVALNYRTSSNYYYPKVFKSVFIIKKLYVKIRIYESFRCNAEKS